jgi:hypothetical protein
MVTFPGLLLSHVELNQGGFQKLFQISSSYKTDFKHQQSRQLFLLLYIIYTTGHIIFVFHLETEQEKVFKITYDLIQFMHYHTHWPVLFNEKAEQPSIGNYQLLPLS